MIGHGERLTVRGENLGFLVADRVCLWLGESAGPLAEDEQEPLRHPSPKEMRSGIRIGVIIGLRSMDHGKSSCVQET